jgi:NagD protein
MENTIKQNYLIDMDGVLVRGAQLIPGADKFIDRLIENEIEFLVLTNNPLFTPTDLSHRLQTMGLNIPATRIFTSALATADFLQNQKPDGKAFVIGESGLTEALHNVGYVLTDLNPDYVVLGETNTYNFELVTKATRLIVEGAHFIATNPDVSAPTEFGLVPACGAMAALIEKATGKSPFFVGKPNPFMMRSALNYLGVHSENTTMIGDRMDTDMVAGIESGMDTILVLSGITNLDMVNQYPYRPKEIVESVAHIKI